MRSLSDALVVGGGPAGAALAIRLAEAGRRVVLIERTAGPHHKVCGEFLSHESIHHLQVLGLEPAALGAVPLETLHVTAGRRSATIPLPFRAMSLSRLVLDEALLSRAVETGADVRRGSAVQALSFERGAWQARLDSGEVVAATHAFLATGKHDLRGWRRPRRMQSDLIGFKMHWQRRAKTTHRWTRRVELHLFPAGYAGFEPVEDGHANLCLLVRRRRFNALGGDWSALLRAMRAASPGLAQSLDDAEPCWSRPLAVGAVPFGSVRTTGGPWRLGDQIAVVPSFAGTGIGIALESARRAADVYLAGGTAGDYERLFLRRIGALARHGAWTSRLLVSAPLQGPLVAALGFEPRGMAWFAAATRVM